LAWSEFTSSSSTTSIRPFKGYDRFREIINRVNDAAVKKRRVDMVYYTMSRKKETRRKVDPYPIWFFNGSFYMIGCCRLRNEVRVFALDRIKLLHQTKETFEVEVAGTIEIKSWIMSWGANALVLEPESLKDEIRAEAMDGQHESGNSLFRGDLQQIIALHPLQRFMDSEFR
jgi:predicted DNA-binding transcriptional regulator YafY